MLAATPTASLRVPFRVTGVARRSVFNLWGVLKTTACAVLQKFHGNNVPTPCSRMMK
jgi:hypothetical protein